jgi:hypothetical protein
MFIGVGKETIKMERDSTPRGFTKEDDRPLMDDRTAAPHNAVFDVSGRSA